MAQFPKTREGLEAGGYSFRNRTACKYCGATIEWWITPNFSYIPLDVATLAPHWSTCPKANEARKPKPAAAAAPAKQKELFR